MCIQLDQQIISALTNCLSGQLRMKFTFQLLAPTIKLNFINRCCIVISIQIGGQAIAARSDSQITNTISVILYTPSQSQLILCYTEKQLKIKKINSAHHSSCCNGKLPVVGNGGNCPSFSLKMQLNIIQLSIYRQSLYY